MLKTVYASAQVLGHVFAAPQKVASAQPEKTSFRDFEFTPREGYLYVAVRAVSARVNRNYDGFSAEELKRAYKSFEGRPVFVNHDNTDVTRARGVILASKYRDENPKDVHVEILMEMDKVSFPKLCHYIQTGEIDTVSMGCNIEYSECSVCANKAYTPTQYCLHVKNKGVPYEVKTASGAVNKLLAFEKCCGVDFFEESWVFDPADTSAMTTALLNEDMMTRKAQSDEEVHRPEAVDTLRSESVCPTCGNENFDGVLCDVCGHTNAPKPMGDVDTDKAKETKLPTEKEEPKSVKQDKSKDSDKEESKDKKTKKGGSQVMAKPNIDAMRSRANHRHAQAGAPVETPAVPSAEVANQPIQAPAETTVDTNPDDTIDIVQPVITEVPVAEVNEVALPAPEAPIPSAVARRHIVRRRSAQAGEPVETPAVQSAEVVNAPIQAPAETTVDVNPDATIDIQAPVITEVPVAEVNEVALPTPAAPAADQAAQMGGQEPQPSITAQRVAFVRAYKLVETRVAMGLEPANTDKTVLADKLSREHTVGELNIAQATLDEVRTASARTVQPRTAGRRPARQVPFTGGNDNAQRKTASTVPDEAIFGL